jgi:hypothetical protein
MVDVGNFHIGTIDMGCLVWTEDLSDYGWWSSLWPISSELRKPEIISLNSSMIRWFTNHHHLIESWNHLNQDSFNFNNLWIHFEVPNPFDSLGTTKSLS